MQMTFPLVVVTLSSLVVLLSCLVLALHRDYHSGVFGTFALALLAFAALARLHGVFEAHESAHRAVSPIALFLWLGAALWFGRTLSHFASRLRKRGTPDWYRDEGERRRAA